MRSTMIIMSLLFAAWVGYEKPETQIVKNYEYTETEARGTQPNRKTGSGLRVMRSGKTEERKVIQLWRLP